MLTLYPRENCTELYNSWSHVLKFTDEMVCVGRGVDAKGVCQVCMLQLNIVYEAAGYHIFYHEQGAIYCLSKG